MADKKKEHHGQQKEKGQNQEEYLKEDCRMYEEKYPKVNDLVMCEIKEIFDDGAYVELLEYNRIKGMLLSTEISRKRVNFVKRLLQEGKQEVLQVLRIDTQKGFFDLSKKSVKAEEIEEFKEKYQKSKTVHGIMRHLAGKLHIPMEELYEQFGWPLYKLFGHAYYAFKEALK